MPHNHGYVALLQGNGTALVESPCDNDLLARPNYHYSKYNITWANTEWINKWQLDHQVPASLKDKLKYMLFIAKIALEQYVFEVWQNLFRHQYQILCAMDGTLDRNQWAFSPIKPTFDANE